ncbi:MAG: tetratricopeptide repeat protein [Planctomycetota bacterium]|nr:MAG: tetratricopeptide repeat protein [Planctomycetota bacterium]
MSKKRTSSASRKRAQDTKGKSGAPSRQTDDKTDMGRTSAPVGRLVRWVALPLLLVVLASVGYLNADHEEFLFDSGFSYAEMANPSQALGRYIQRTFWPPWRPGQNLTRVSFMLNAMVNRTLGLEWFDVTSFLVVNVLIHAFNVCLVYFLVSAMLGRIDPDRPKPVWIPLALAALFAVHPIHASSVAYIIQRRGALATTFYVLAILSYLGARKNDKSTFSRPWQRFALAAAVPICYWLSIKSKPMALTLPFAILAIEFCLRASDRVALKRYLIVLIPGMVLSVIAMFIFAWSQGLFDPSTFQIRPWGHQLIWGPWVHFLTESRAFVHYWKLLILPLPQWSCVDHDFELSRSLLDRYAIIAIVFHGFLLLAAVFAALRRYPLAAAGIFWFYITLIPYIALPQVELLVEYKTYLPSIGLFLILAEVFRGLQHRIPPVATTVMIVAMAAVLLTTTVRRNVIYQSAFNFWSDVLEKYPNHHRPNDSLGIVLYKQGKINEAIAHYRKALQIAPNYPEALNNLAAALVHVGQIDEGIECYKKSLKIKKRHPHAHYNLANALVKKGNIDEAIYHYHQAMEFEPNYPYIYHKLARALMKKGSIDEGLARYQEALEMMPDKAVVHNSMALDLSRLNRTKEAIEHYTMALQLRPDYAQAHNNLGTLYARLEKLAEAIKHFEKAVKIDPKFSEAYNNLGGTYARLKQFDKARKHLQTALKINPNFANAYANLGNVLFEQGKISEAIANYHKALGINPAHLPAQNGLKAALAKQKELSQK